MVASVVGTALLVLWVSLFITPIPLVLGAWYHEGWMRSELPEYEWIGCDPAYDDVVLTYAGFPMEYWYDRGVEFE